ncbi:IclR family transcriptional regulator [Streptomyces sp. 8L]|uniref:IclR family transcriptional regulator n=1 Tax=unclassified Streptomyces TaxID=2593676 RepID=UPI001CD392C1|nr:helix-turn-helix domain-containing protein [Streptomyces sp. 8L]MCA1220073.1 helix-turn-helix domain-containing protein [Streptomyces sp. 8L]
MDGGRRLQEPSPGTGGTNAGGRAEPGPPGAPLRKALTVLEALAEASRPLTLSELARLVNLPKSSLHRMLQVLTDLGLTVRMESKSYELGAGLLRLAAAGAPARIQRLGYAVTPFLIELFQRTRRIVSLGTLSGTNVRHVGTLYGREHTGLAMALRQPVPAHCSAAGRLLLATAMGDPGDRAKDAAPGLTPAGADSLRRDFERIRRTGFSYARSAHVPGLVELAAPVRLGRTGTVAAVVVADNVHNTDLRDAGQALLNTATAIEQGLADTT